MFLNVTDRLPVKNGGSIEMKKLRETALCDRRVGKLLPGTLPHVCFSSHAFEQILFD